MYSRQPLKMRGEAIDATMLTLIQQYQEKARDARQVTEAQGRAYRVAFSKQKGDRSDAGSWYQVPDTGKGRRLRTSDMVVLSVTGTLPDETVKVGALMPAVAIGLQKISPYGHIKVMVPPEKGFGEDGLPSDIPGGATLIFDITVSALAR